MPTAVTIVMVSGQKEEL